MQTIFMLMAKYDAQPIVPIDKVRADFFGDMSKPVFTKKVESGEIPLPLVVLGQGQKAPKGFNLSDLAKYLDDQTDAARRELKKKLQ